MDSNKRFFIMAGIAFFVLAGLFPPWTYTYELPNRYSEEPAGYSFIAFAPPRRGKSFRHGVKMDMQRLLVQWVITIAACGCGVVLFPVKRYTSKQQPKANKGDEYVRELLKKRGVKPVD